MFDEEADTGEEVASSADRKKVVQFRCRYIFPLHSN